MPEEAKSPEPQDFEKKPYQSPVLVQYGTLAEITGGKTSAGTDLLPGSRR